MNEFLTSHICSTTIISGAGSISQLPEIIKTLKIEKPMIVTDNNLYKLEIVKRIEKTLDKVIVYHQVTPNPKDVEVMKASSLYKQEHCDGVIGIGGGSSLDAAKSISAIVRHDGFIMDYGRSTPNRKYFRNGREKLVLVPTTCGTGSEISPHAVITNTKKNRKSDLQETIFYPDYVILDPELLLSLPEKIAKDTGIDALCHAIEVYTSKKSIENFAPLHTEAARNAIQLIAQNLRKVIHDPNDVSAKSKLQWAATLAGFSLDLDATIGHGLAGQLQKYHPEISHGESVGMLLPTILEYNAKFCPERMRNIAEAFGEKVDTDTDEQVNEKVLSAVRNLLREINFPKLSDFMIDSSEINKFYQEGAANSCNRNNIRPVIEEEIKELYYKAYQETYNID